MLRPRNRLPQWWLGQVCRDYVWTLVNTRKTQGISAYPNWSKSLIARAANLRDQGVGGSNPLPRPFLIFRPVEDHVKGLSVTGIDTYAIDGAVQKNPIRA